MKSFRLLLGALIVGSLLVLTATTTFATRHHGSGTDPAYCLIGPATLGGPLTITGSGYAPGATYIVNITWPNNIGTMGTGVTADVSGSWSTILWAYYAGQYFVNVDATSGNHALLASCSTTVS